MDVADLGKTGLILGETDPIGGTEGYAQHTVPDVWMDPQGRTCSAAATMLRRCASSASASSRLRCARSSLVSSSACAVPAHVSVVGRATNALQVLASRAADSRSGSQERSWLAR